jgi:hypothetical protein
MVVDLRAVPCLGQIHGESTASSAFGFMKTNWVLYDRGVSGTFFSVGSFAM